MIQGHYRLNSLLGVVLVVDLQALLTYNIE